MEALELLGLVPPRAVVTVLKSSVKLVANAARFSLISSSFLLLFLYASCKMDGTNKTQYLPQDVYKSRKLLLLVSKAHAFFIEILG